jgi:hypothetical protein
LLKRDWTNWCHLIGFPDTFVTKAKACSWLQQLHDCSIHSFTVSCGHVGHLQPMISTSEPAEGVVSNTMITIRHALILGCHLLLTGLFYIGAFSPARTTRTHWLRKGLIAISAMLIIDILTRHAYRTHRSVKGLGAVISGVRNLFSSIAVLLAWPSLLSAWKPPTVGMTWRQVGLVNYYQNITFPRTPIACINSNIGERFR